VTGAGGGMGLCAVQLAKALGAIVIAAASSDEKLELAKRHGADYTINYAKDDMKQKVNEFTQGSIVSFWLLFVVLVVVILLSHMLFFFLFLFVCVFVV
jgi:NADPH:quinone reductase-like Zn-dependent oxidoreductase